MRGSYRRIGRELLDSITSPLREGLLSSSSLSETSTPNTIPFQYTPLSCNKTTFRILHLKRQNDGSDRLRGSLVEAPISNAPEYYALSYTWGDPTPCETIRLDGDGGGGGGGGGVLGITANCAAALRRMIRSKSQRLIWVDSICINQSTSSPRALEERGAQVAMMDSIYRNAVQVNVHLGEGSPASDAACVAVKALMTSYLGAVAPGPQQGFARRKYEKVCDEVLATTPEFPYGKLHGIFKLPWFTRTWVLQEVVFGRNVIFYLGKHLLHLKFLVFASDFTRLPYSKLDETNARHWRSYLAFHDTLNECVALRRKAEGGGQEEQKKEEGEGKLTLMTILMAPAIMLEATRPEDKIHALYGICRALNFRLPEPDYKKPVARVYTEAATEVLRVEPSFEMLSCACETSAWDEWGLPSWVPNFSGCIRKWSPVNNPPHIAMFGGGGSESEKKKRNICGNIKWFHDLRSDDDDGGVRLAVKGRRLDMIQSVGLPWMTDATTTMLGVGGGMEKPTGQYLSSLLDCIGTWFQVVMGEGSSGRDMESAVQVLMRVLMFQSSQDVTYQEMRSYSRLLMMVAGWLGTNDTAAPASALLALPEENPASYLQMGEMYTVGPLMYAFFTKIFLCHWKTVFCTLGGYMGLATHTIRQGDIVVVLNGSWLASVLRPVDGGSGEFRYVGPAHVDGISDGSFWRMTSFANDEEFVLV